MKILPENPNLQRDGFISGMYEPKNFTKGIKKITPITPTTLFG